VTVQVNTAIKTVFVFYIHTQLGLSHHLVFNVFYNFTIHRSARWLNETEHVMILHIIQFGFLLHTCTAFQIISEILNMKVIYLRKYFHTSSYSIIVTCSIRSFLCWCEVEVQGILSVQLFVVQMVKKFSAFYGTPSFITTFTEAHSLTEVLSVKDTEILCRYSSVIQLLYCIFKLPTSHFSCFVLPKTTLNFERNASVL
jgi:hypothetical protein